MRRAVAFGDFERELFDLVFLEEWLWDDVLLRARRDEYMELLPWQRKSFTEFFDFLLVRLTSNTILRPTGWLKANIPESVYTAIRKKSLTYFTKITVSSFPSKRRCESNREKPVLREGSFPSIFTNTKIMVV